MASKRTCEFSQKTRSMNFLRKFVLLFKDVRYG